jgi:hypothetical protein
MAEKWDVSSWDSRLGPRAKQFHGCFETRFGADRYIETESREHPDRTHQLEECNHSGHAHSKAGGA